MTATVSRAPREAEETCRIDIVRGQRSTRRQDESSLRSLQLACELARRYAGAYCSGPELVRIASLGLVRAVETFELDPGKSFRTFAEPLIVVAELEDQVRNAKAHIEATANDPARDRGRRIPACAGRGDRVRFPNNGPCANLCRQSGFNYG